MIEVSGLTRTFGDVTAVDKLTFRVNPGEVLGFLGPNGAGKSTTMKMLTGFLSPDSGSISIFGQDVLNNPVAAQQMIGYLPEGAPAWSDMSVSAFLHFIGKIRGMSGAHFRERLARVVQQVALDSVMDQRIETLSKGFKRRVGLAQALLHDPQVLILDEPTDGLDPNQKFQVRSLIKGLAKDKIVIISTHILEEVHAVCTRALIIAAGRIVADGTPDHLASLSPHHQAVHVRFADDQASDWAHDQAHVAALRALPLVESIEVSADGREMTLFPKRGASILASVNQLIHNQGWPVEEFHVEQGRLEDVFRRITMGEVA